MRAWVICYLRRSHPGITSTVRQHNIIKTPAGKCMFPSNPIDAGETCLGMIWKATRINKSWLGVVACHGRRFPTLGFGRREGFIPIRLIKTAQNVSRGVLTAEETPIISTQRLPRGGVESNQSRTAESWKGGLPSAARHYLHSSKCVQVAQISRLYTRMSPARNGVS